MCEGSDKTGITQSDILQPLCRCYQSRFTNTRQVTLISIEALLKSCGHILSDGWTDIISLLGSVAGGENGADDIQQNREEMIPISFRSLQLVADEFLESLTSPKGITECLCCLSVVLVAAAGHNLGASTGERRCLPFSSTEFAVLGTAHGDSEANHA